MVAPSVGNSVVVKLEKSAFSTIELPIDGATCHLREFRGDSGLAPLDKEGLSCDKDRHTRSVDKESDSVREGQTYLRGRQGEQQRATRTDIFAP